MIEEQKRLKIIEDKLKLLNNKKTVLEPTFDKKNNIFSDLLASVLVGFVLGYNIDRLFNFKPLGLTVCLILSVLAAIYKIMKN